MDFVIVNNYNINFLDNESKLYILLGNTLDEKKIQKIEKKAHHLIIVGFDFRQISNTKNTTQKLNKRTYLYNSSVIHNGAVYIGVTDLDWLYVELKLMVLSEKFKKIVILLKYHMPIDIEKIKICMKKADIIIYRGTMQSCDSNFF